MDRVIFRTIVSAAHELNFIKMSIRELHDLVDFFLVTESNITHSGERRDFAFSRLLQESGLLDDPKVIYIPMDLSDLTKEWSNSSEILHSNEQIIRHGFTRYFEVNPQDVVISCDADEVLYNHRVKVLIRRLRRTMFPRKSYSLKLNQFIFKLSFFWKDCDFRGPVVCRADYFMKMENPQWRYDGTRTLVKSGAHFSWIMSPAEMVKKILNYSHRLENQQYANEDLLREAIEKKQYIFEPERSFEIIELKSWKNRKYPKSLSSVIGNFSSEIL